MALSHFNNSKASTGMYEPVVPANFDCTILLPSILTSEPLLTEHIISIDGLDGLYPNNSIIEQKFKQSTRSYAGAPETTAFDLTITLSLNLNDAHENYIYNCIRNWYNLIWNPADGTKTLKREYYGSSVIYQYDRDGSIWRKVNIKVCFPTSQPTGLGNVSIDGGNEASQLSFSLRCDLSAEGNRGII